MRDTPVERTASQLHLQALWLQLERQRSQDPQEVPSMLVEGLGKREGDGIKEVGDPDTRGRRRLGGTHSGGVSQGQILRGHIYLTGGPVQPRIRGRQEELGQHKHKGVSRWARACVPWSWLTTKTIL